MAEANKKQNETVEDLQRYCDNLQVSIEHFKNCLHNDPTKTKSFDIQ